MRPSAIAALSVGLLLSASTQSWAQDHIYNLNGTYADANGGPSLAAIGGTLGANGFSFGFNEGLSLTGVFGSSYTVAMRFRFDDVTGYRRIIDFQNRTSDNGPYVLDGAANFYNIATGPTAPYAPNQMGLTILTRTQTGLFTAYFGGAMQYQFADNLSDGVPAGNTVNFFQDDLAFANEASAGFVDYIGTWDRALSSREVAAFVPGGPVTTTPEPSSMLLVGVGILFAGIARNRKRINV
ncbi:MAG: PEP-CTERM sorting domain-containing protein [Gemmatimonadaceae bacterium]